jgi:glucuronate isomerase
MSRPFIHDDFLLGSKTARELYHGHASAQPIIDFHNHLPPALIAANHRFADLHEIWLAGDHYKWRAMRTNGIPERMVTDSRSFLSFPRHEYFRRVFCDLIGREVESGSLPDDPGLLGVMVSEICFGNARDFLGMSSR